MCKLQHCQEKIFVRKIRRFSEKLDSKLPYDIEVWYNIDYWEGRDPKIYFYLSIDDYKEEKRVYHLIYKYWGIRGFDSFGFNFMTFSKEEIRDDGKFIYRSSDKDKTKTFS